jgi:hypothetical protein
MSEVPCVGEAHSLSGGPRVQVAASARATLVQVPKTWRAEEYAVA